MKRFSWWWCHKDYWHDEDDTIPMHTRGAALLLPEGEEPQGGKDCWVKFKTEQASEQLATKVAALK